MERALPVVSSEERCPPNAAAPLLERDSALPEVIECFHVPRLRLRRGLRLVTRHRRRRRVAIGRLKCDRRSE